MKTAFIALASGVIGFLVGSTVQFVRDFDKEYDFDLGDIYE